MHIYILLLLAVPSSWWLLARALEWDVTGLFNTLRTTERSARCIPLFIPALSQYSVSASPVKPPNGSRRHHQRNHHRDPPYASALHNNQFVSHVFVTFLLFTQSTRRWNLQNIPIPFQCHNRHKVVVSQKNQKRTAIPWDVQTTG